MPLRNLDRIILDRGEYSLKYLTGETNGNMEFQRS